MPLDFMDAVDVADVVKQGSDDEAVFRDLPRSTLCESPGLQCMICHTASVLVMTVTANCKVIAVLEKRDYILDSFSLGRAEKICDSCLSVHSKRLCEYVR